MEDQKAILVAKMPKRINPAPKAGEKRDAVDANGDCTNDLMVDIALFGISSLESGQKMMELMLSARNEAQAKGLVRPLMQSMVAKCDELVDRYGDTAECKSSDGSTVRMSEVKSQCALIRRQVGQL